MNNNVFFGRHNHIVKIIVDFNSCLEYIYIYIYIDEYIMLYHL